MKPIISEIITVAIIFGFVPFAFWAFYIITGEYVR